MNFHITNEGEIAVCTASERACPRGGHFPTVEEALKHVVDRENSFPEQATTSVDNDEPKLDKARELLAAGASPTDIKKAIWSENPDLSGDIRSDLFKRIKKEHMEAAIHETTPSDVPKIGKVWKSPRGKEYLYVDKNAVAKAAGVTIQWADKKVIGATLFGRPLKRDEAFAIYSSLPTVSVDMATGSVAIKKSEKVLVAPERSDKLDGFVKWRVEQMIDFANKNGGLRLLASE